VISNQISDLERQITTTADAKSAATISDKMTSFDQLETNHKIAEKQYTGALQTFERARLTPRARRSISPPSCLRCCPTTSPGQITAC
jgi:capsule polysaccharide export protein KpsE/RkpR